MLQWATFLGMAAVCMLQHASTPHRTGRYIKPILASRGMVAFILPPSMLFLFLKRHGLVAFIPQHSALPVLDVLHCPFSILCPDLCPCGSTITLKMRR